MSSKPIRVEFQTPQTLVDVALAFDQADTENRISFQAIQEPGRPLSVTIVFNAPLTDAQREAMQQLEEGSYTPPAELLETISTP